MRGLNDCDGWLTNGDALFEVEFWFKFCRNCWIELFVDDELDGGALIAGWPTCSGAGLFECARITHPPKKLNKEATVSHARKVFLMSFMLIAFQ